MKRLLLVIASLAAVFTATAATVYVKSDGSDEADGTTWASAYATLHRAVDKAAAGDEIRMAAGVYRYSTATNAVINKNLSVYGGFKGVSESETVEGRTPDVDQTILTGDVDDDDVWAHRTPGFVNFTDAETTTTEKPIVDGKVNIPAHTGDFDYYRLNVKGTNGGKKIIAVVKGISAPLVTLDGLWFVACSFPGNSGVVHLNQNEVAADSTFRNLRFVGCVGGGHNTGAFRHCGGNKIYVDNCKFISCYNNGGHGAGFYQTSGAVLTNCEFSDISYAITGAVICNRGGTLTATDTVVTRCVASASNPNGSYGAACLLLSGGGTSAVVFDRLKMTNCGTIVTGTSSGNTIPLLRRSGNVIVKDSYFANNRMSTGIKANKTYAMFECDDAGSEQGDALRFVNTTFKDNVMRARANANELGESAVGIIGGPHTPVEVVNCTFIDNEAYGFDNGSFKCHASRGIVRTSLSNPAKNTLGLANSTFVGSCAAPDVLVVNPAKDNFANIVNCVFRNESGTDAIQAVGTCTATTPVNLVKTSVYAMDTVPANLTVVTPVDTDPILLTPGEKTILDGTMPVLLPGSRSASVLDAADVTAVAAGFAYRLDADSAWVKLNAVQANLNNPTTSFYDALNATRTFGSFTRGAIQGLTAAATSGSTVVVRKSPRLGGTVSSEVQVVAPGAGLADITATPDASAGTTFAGWYADAECAQLISANATLTSADYAVSGDSVIYAKFGMPKVSITFELGDFGTFADGSNRKVVEQVSGDVFKTPSFTMNAGYVSEGFAPAIPNVVPTAATTYTLKAVSTGIRVIYAATESAGMGDGSSWENATADIQAAIDDAGRYRGEVWMKKGFYFPPASGYYMKANVELVGGFAGDETSRDQADPEENPVVICGDVGLGNKFQRTTQNFGLTTTVKVWEDGKFNFDENLLMSDERGWQLPFSNGGSDIDTGFYLSSCTNTAFYGLTLSEFATHAIYDMVGNSGRVKLEKCKVLAGTTFSYNERIAIELKAGTWLEAIDCEFKATHNLLSVSTALADATNIVRRCQFIGNFTTVAASPCLRFYGVSTAYLVEDCLFRRNGSTTGGAVAIISGSQEANVPFGLVRNCVFEDNRSFGACNGLLSFTPNGTVAAPEGAFRFEGCTFARNGYDALSYIGDSTAHSAVSASLHEKAVAYVNCYFADNFATVTNGFCGKQGTTADGVVGSVYAAVSGYGACRTLFYNCTMERNAVTFKPAPYWDGGETKAAAATFAATHNGRFGLVNCVVADSVLEGASEIYNRKQYDYNQISLVNTIIKNETVGYVPYVFAPVGGLSSYTPTVMSCAISGIDKEALGWQDSTQYAAVTNISSNPGPLAAAAKTAPSGTFKARGVSSGSLYVRGGVPVYRHTDGFYYVKIPGISGYRALDYNQSYGGSQQTIDTETAFCGFDAFGAARDKRHIPYGPLNANNRGFRIQVK